MSGIVLAGKILRYEKRIPKQTLDTEYAAGTRTERIAAHLVGLFLPIMNETVSEDLFDEVQADVERYVAEQIVEEVKYKHKSSKEKEAIKKRKQAEGEKNVHGND